MAKLKTRRQIEKHDNKTKKHDNKGKNMTDNSETQQKKKNTTTNMDHHSKFINMTNQKTQQH